MVALTNTAVAGYTPVSVVLVTAAAGTWHAASPPVVISTEVATTTADDVGAWTVDLLPNAAITPAGSYYLVREGRSDPVSTGRVTPVVLPGDQASYTLDDVTVGTPQPPTAGAPVAWSDVRAYGAAGDGVTNDTAAVQAAVDALPAAGGVVYLPAGTYLLTAAVTLRSDLVLQGDGAASSVLKQSATAVDCLAGTDIAHLTVRDLQLLGPGSGSGKGLHLARGVATSTPYLAMQNVVVSHLGGNGVDVSNAIVSTLVGVTVANCGGDGFRLHGDSGVAGTSTSLVSCYANANTGSGYNLSTMVYCALVGCAADANTTGYTLTSCQGVALTGCGGESNTSTCVTVSGGTGLQVANVWVYDNQGDGIHITGSATAMLTGCVDNTPHSGATSFIKVDAGCSVLVTDCVNVTANSLAANTTNTVTSSGGVLTTLGTAAFGNSPVLLKKTAAADVELDNFGGVLCVANSVAVLNAGNGIRIAEGSNAKMGTATLTGTSAVTVTTNAVQSSSRIFLTTQTPGGTPASPYVSAVSAGVSFAVKSTGASDTSTVAWLIVDPS